MSRLVVCLILAASAASCSRVDVPVVPEGTTVSYAEHLEPLVIARCESCHTVDEPEANLVLERGMGYEAMVGRPSTQVPTMPMVAPGDVEGSYLWRKLIHDVEIGRGMPRSVVGSIELPADELELYRRWIDEGAQP
jgi:hypothetical protein